MGSLGSTTLLHHFALTAVLFTDTNTLPEQASQNHATGDNSFNTYYSQFTSTSTIANVLYGMFIMLHGL